ncbi:hypothetical protein TYRP_004863, partial [Tyrophagus putrescentiae]
TASTSIIAILALFCCCLFSGTNGYGAMYGYGLGLGGLAKMGMMKWPFGYYPFYGLGGLGGLGMGGMYGGGGFGYGGGYGGFYGGGMGGYGMGGGMGGLGMKKGLGMFATDVEAEAAAAAAGDYYKRMAQDEAAASMMMNSPLGGGGVGMGGIGKKYLASASTVSGKYIPGTLGTVNAA